MTTLDRARELAHLRSWPELADLAGAVDGDTLARAPELAYLLADALRRTGKLERSRPLAIAAERSAHRIADAQLVLRCVNLLGMLDFESGEIAEADTRFGELLDRAAALGNDEFAARASNNLGIIANLRGQTQLALTSYQHAVAAYQRIGHERGLAQTHYNLGISYRDLGFDADADAHYDLAIHHAEIANSNDVVALAETERALLRARAGDGDLSESIGNHALARLEAMGDPVGAANTTRILAAAALARGIPRLALERLDRALGIIDSHPDPLLRAEIQLDRGSLLPELGDSPAAAAALRESIDTFQRLGAGFQAEAARALLHSIDPSADAV